MDEEIKHGSQLQLKHRKGCIYILQIPLNLERRYWEIQFVLLLKVTNYNTDTRAVKIRIQEFRPSSRSSSLLNIFKEILCHQ